MDPDPFEYFYYQFANARVKQYPYPHMILEGLFSDAYYQEILGNLPADNCYLEISKAGRTGGASYTNRGIFNLNEDDFAKLQGVQREFWQKFQKGLYSQRFFNLVLAKFAKGIQRRFEGTTIEPELEQEAMLVRDTAGYSLGPHTDTQPKLLTLLFYLPSDESHSDMGTSIFIPKKRVPRDPRVHYPFEEFHLVETAPFIPNSCFGFLRENDSWHGVLPFEKSNVIRNTLCYRILVKNLSAFGQIREG